MLLSPGSVTAAEGPISARYVGEALTRVFTGLHLLTLCSVRALGREQ